MEKKPQNDVMMPRIGEEAERPRLACPGCKAKPPRQLGVDDFPVDARMGVEQAVADGADFFGCDACGKRWAVMRQRMVKGEDGVVSLEPVRRAPPPARKSAVRRVRRAQESINARAIKRNERLAARSGEPVERPLPVVPTLTPEEQRKARNVAKAKRQAARKGGSS